MSYASEPYAQFVDDLLMALTGGIIRQHFRFLKEFEPYRLTDPDPIIPNTVQVFGIADGTYRRFRVPIDYQLLEGSIIDWSKRDDGTPAADAVWPDQGTTFYANFESVSESGAAPKLTDRNPGSVTRLLAESFAREFAVVSRQLEEVYRAGFIDTASGRDLDQLASLVGVTRRSVTFASGVVLFARSTPAPADIFIPAGARLSTTVPPPVMFETIQAETLRRGNLSVEVPVQAIVAGSSGMVPVNAIGVIHRPILGIETVTNSTPTTFGGSVESDEAVRRRARRALEGAGLATTGALTAALTTIPGLREKDIQIAEDPLAHPGVVKLSVALPPIKEAPDSVAERERIVTQAVELIEQTRPVGVRILHNIDAPRPVSNASPKPGTLSVVEGDPVAVGTAAPDGLFMPVDVIAHLSPTTLSLTPQQRDDLIERGRKTVSDFLGEAGIGEILVYNRLIERLMKIEGVLDVAVEIFPRHWAKHFKERASKSNNKNVVGENPAVRPVEGLITVEVGGALVMLDMAVTVKRKEAGLLESPDTAAAAAAQEIEAKLRTTFNTHSIPMLSSEVLIGRLSMDNYTVTQLHYNVEYQEAGVRIHQQDIQLPLTALEQLWVRKVKVTAL